MQNNSEAAAGRFLRVAASFNISVKRLGDILDIPQEPHSLTPMREGGGQGRLALNDIAFRYSEHLPWLYRNLNIALPPANLPC